MISNVIIFYLLEPDLPEQH